MKKGEKLLQRRRLVVPAAVGQYATATAEKGEGAVLVDLAGRELIDMACGIGVTSLGHCPDLVTRAIKEQADKLLHACIHVAAYEPYIRLCEKLASLFPHGPRTKVFLANTGAEAVENAVKIARQATGRPGILAFSEGFHGRTLMALSLTSKVGYKIGCGPFAPEVYRLPFPNYYRYRDGLNRKAFVERELERLRQAFVSMVAPKHLAAILIEPIQGEGGFNCAPAEYLQGLRKICDEHGILLICDEVQSGFCRTGKWAAYMHAEVVPDLSTWAKAMGSGLPIAAVLGKAKIMDACAPGTLGGTYGGNPLSCVAALATIRIMEERRLAERAARLGERIRKRFKAIQKKCPLVGDVRGLGAMMAMELVLDGNPEHPATDAAGSIIQGCLEDGVLCITAGAHGNILRVLPPLVISDEQLDTALGVIEKQVMHVSKKPKKNV